LKNRKHSDNVAAKLSQYQTEATITPDVTARRQKNEYFKQSRSAVTIPAPTFPTERQYSAMLSRDRDRSSGSIGPQSVATPVVSSVGSQSEGGYETPSLMVILGPCEALKRYRPHSQPALQNELVENRAKRRRLSHDDDLFELTRKKNEDLNLRIEALELLTQSLVENSRKNEELNAQCLNLEEFNQRPVEDTDISRRRIDGVETSAEAAWGTCGISERHDSQVGDLRNSISAITKMIKEHGLHIEQVMSNAVEMEQSLEQLQELCSAQSQKLDAASKVEREMKDRLMMVQRLALRQADAMKDASRETEETERRFARLEDMIISRTSDTLRR
jgi:hypothetical protein